MEYEKTKFLIGVDSQKALNEIKPINIPEKKHQQPHTIFENFKKTKSKK